MLSPDYVAGLFDGEGTISLIYSKIRPWKLDPSKHVLGFKLIIGISNTYQDILCRLQNQFAGDLCIATKGSGHHKPVWAWKITSTAPQRHFLQTIERPAIIKSRQIALGLLYLDTKVARGKRLDAERWNKRIEIFRELRALNQRGLSKPSANIIPPTPSEAWNPVKRTYSDDELAEMMRHVRDPHGRWA